MGGVHADTVTDAFADARFFFPEVLDLRTIARAFYAVAGQ